MSILEHDAVRRAVRTFAQAFVAALVVLLPTDLVGEVGVYLEALAAAGYAGAVALVTWVHNELEDAGRVRDRR